jgi:hypothetical protein
MSLALNLIFAAKARSTHHKLALDALRHLRAAGAEPWRDAFLYYADNYLEGAKAPDAVFKDFKNHVLHVGDNFWGGAVGAATNWYRHLLCELRARNWSEAAYCAGVLSHYYTDPLMPFHTGQSESEGAVHRAAEWSITKSYEVLRDLQIEQLGGWPEVQLGEGPFWLRDAIHEGAKLAHPHYDFLIDHYDLERGVKNPPEGLDQASREILAQLLGYAAVGFGRILDKAIAEAGVAPPTVRPSPQTIFATLGAPIGAVAKTFADQKERAQILAMYDEYLATGKCLVTMPEDERIVRASYAKEVLKVPLAQLDAEKPRKPGLQYATGAGPRFVTVKPFSNATSPTRDTKAEQPEASPIRREIEPASPRVDPPRELPEAVEDRPALDSASEEGVVARAMDELPAVAPKRSVKQVAAQVQQAIVPGAKRAASAVVSLMRRFTAKPKPAEAPVATVRKGRTASVKAFINRFRPKPKAAPAANDESEAVEFISVSGKAKTAQSLLAASEGSANAAAKFYLELKSSVEDGPSIGPKMAKRMAAVGVKTIEQFLNADPLQLGAKLGFNASAAAKIKDWQDQARLVCRIPNLRGHDAQILIACGIREPKQLANASAASLTKQAIEFAKGAEGQRLLRGSSMPDAEEVAEWIEWAQAARGLKAA